MRTRTFQDRALLAVTVALFPPCARWDSCAILATCRHSGSRTISPSMRLDCGAFAVQPVLCEVGPVLVPSRTPSNALASSLSKREARRQPLWRFSAMTVGASRSAPELDGGTPRRSRRRAPRGEEHRRTPGQQAQGMAVHRDPLRQDPGPAAVRGVGVVRRQCGVGLWAQARAATSRVKAAMMTATRT